jgi:hypothetical protein
MITISNLRKEQLPETKECRIICDIECSFSKARHLWFSVPEEFGDWLTDDVYDAFMVAMLFPAMYYKQDLHVDGCVSEHLHDSITNYVQHCEKAYLPYLHEINVTVNGYGIAKKTNHLVGTGFSAGIDAFSTLYDRFEREQKPNYKLSALFFFNVGSHGGGGKKARQKFYDRYNYLLPLTRELGLPFVPMDSNLFDYYQFEWEYDAGVLCRSTGILVFQRVLDKYYVAYDYSYWEIVYMTAADYASITDMCNDYLLQTENLEIIVDGTQYRRSDKTINLLNYPPFLKYLNVCVTLSDGAHNCSLCHKCKRTLLTLDILNRLEDATEVFDIEKFKKCLFKYKCYTVLHSKSDIYAHDNCQLAKKMNYPMPSYWVAWLYMSPSILMSSLKKVAKFLLRRRSPQMERHYPV